MTHLLVSLRIFLDWYIYLSLCYSQLLGMIRQAVFELWGFVSLLLFSPPFFFSWFVSLPVSFSFCHTNTQADCQNSCLQLLILAVSIFIPIHLQGGPKTVKSPLLESSTQVLVLSFSSFLKSDTGRNQCHVLIIWTTAIFQKKWLPF